MSWMGALRFLAGADRCRSRDHLDLSPWPMGGEAGMTANCTPLLVGSLRSSGLRAESPLDARTMSAIRHRSALEGCKWDTQVGDMTTLAPFPLVMKRSVWEQLSEWAEQLTAEAAEAEKEISQQPDLLRLLGLPRKLQHILA